MIEEFIEGKEVTVGVVETEKPIALPSLEIKTTKRYLDYEAKYSKGFNVLKNSIRITYGSRSQMSTFFNELDKIQ